MTLPRVSEILKEIGPVDEAVREFIKPRAYRRGRLVEAAATLLAQGRSIEPGWWTRASGEGNDDRVEHEECRPYVDSAAKFLRENPLTLLHPQPGQPQLEVTFPELFVGHVDWVVDMRWPDNRQLWGIVDVKCGEPPTEDSPYDLYCRYQLAMYLEAYVSMFGRFPRLANLHLWPGNYRLIMRTKREDRHAAIIMAEFYNLPWVREKYAA